MTQAGVSQHIAQLEAQLGIELFARRRRGVELTPAGAAFYATVEQGLKILADGVAAVRRQAGRRTLKILTDYGFAAWWLMPRLSLIAELLPGVEVQIATTQAPLEATDADFDVGVMFGEGEWSGFRTTPLFPEEVYPVCAPARLDGRSAPLEPEQIAAMRLLHLRSASGDRWHTWSDWFSAHRLAAEFGREDLAFDNFQLVLQAAILGQGVCLGWAPLIDDLVQAGGLVKLTETPLRSGRGYHLVEHSNRPYAANVAVFKRWLLDQLPAAAASGSPPPQDPPSLPPRAVASASADKSLTGA